MKLAYKKAIILISGAVAAAIPFTLFYWLWSWCINQVPVASEWAGLIKVGLTLLMVFVGGGFTLAAAFIVGAFAVAVMAEIFD